MFCKFCGEKIERSCMKCSKCGRDVGRLEGGVGFWDLAEKPAQHPPVQEPKQEVKQNQKAAASKPVQKKTQSQKILILMLLGSIVLNIAALSASSRAKSSQEELNEKIDHLSSALLQLQANTETDYATSEDIQEVKDLLNSIMPESSSKEITIIQAPENIELSNSIAATQTEPVSLFSICADGSSVSFQWQKYQPNEDQGPGQWVDLSNEEDFYSINTENLDDGSICSHLSAQHIQEGIYGAYRVMITDANENHEFLYCFARQDTAYQE